MTGGTTGRQPAAGGSGRGWRGPVGRGYPGGWLARLGAGVVHPEAVSRPAAMLDRAAAGRRLPVPPAGLLVVAGRRLPADDAAVAALLGPLRPGRSVLVGPVDPAAGPLQEAATDDPAGLAEAVRAGWGSGELVVLAAGAAVHAAAVRRPVGAAAGLLAVAHVREVTAAGRRAGEPPRELALPAPARGRGPHRGTDGVPLPPWGMRLTRLVRAVERDVARDWALLEVADDLRTCWLQRIGDCSVSARSTG